MKKGTKALQGSKRCDAFKKWHKKLPKTWYACDGDLFLLDKDGILVLLDYKWHNDKIRWSHMKLYAELIEKGIPVYLIEQINHDMEFMIYKYIPQLDEKGRPYYVLEYEGNDFVEWEANLRERRKEDGSVS